MKIKFISTRARRKQGGYALLLVVFLTALVVVGTMSIGLRILTEGRRQQEQEMIWRGKQYTRGVKLYYRKFGRFPNSMDDLVKPKMGNLRFMRQAYKDPMNKEDGSWRLIYVGPAGQLIGSLKPQQNGIQLPPAPTAGSPPVPAGSLSSGTFGSQPATATAGGVTTPGAPGGPTTTGTGTGAQGTDTTGTGASQAIPTGDTPTIIGGNIIGVGSKVNHSSVIVYEKAENYRLFEFIWDPSKDLGVVPPPGTPIGTPAGTPGAPGAPPQNPLSPPTAPPTNPPPPNPQQP